MAERALTIGAAPRVLEARLAEPDVPARGGAVVCHPHPEYGGDMHNPVVLAAVRGCLDGGRAALRFNFAGVGASGGRYDGGPGEVGDVAVAVAALRAVLPVGAACALVGYSFGAWAAARAASDLDDVRLIAIAPPLEALDWGFAAALRVPVAVIVGDRDPFCPRERLASLPSADVTLLAGADHFLSGREDEVAAAVRARL